MDAAARHAEERNGPTEKPAPIALSLILFLVLFLWLAAALGGFLGGGPYRRLQAESAEAALEIAAPRVLRTGEYFELRLSGTARTPIGKPTVAFGLGLFRNTTINSFYPAATSEMSSAVELMFEYSPLGAGEQFTIKIDGQVNDNMTGTLVGPVALRDGDVDLAKVDLIIKVLP